MVGILLVIIASCALNQALAANEWTKVENPLSSDKYRERSSKLFPNTSKINKFLRAELGQFPFHALLNLKGSTNTHFNDCSGSIISYNWILTAAYWYL